MKRIILIFFITLSVIVQAQPTISNNGMFYRSFAGNGLLNNLISLWGLDETTGTTAFDSHGINDGTINSATINQSGIIDKAFLFNGTSDYVYVPSISNLLVNNPTTISVSAWFKTTSTTPLSILGTFNDGATTGISILLNFSTVSASGYFRLFIRDNNNNTFVIYSATSHSSIYDGNWHNIVFVRAGSTTGALYLDGSPISVSYDNSGTASSFSAFNYDFHIGSGNNRGALYFPFNGTLDQLAIWGTALTSTNAETMASAIPYSNFTAQIEQSIKTIYNRFYENISDVKIPLRIAS